MRANISKTVRGVGEKGLLWLKIAVLVAAGLMPAVTFEPAEAAQLESRSVNISTSEPSPGSGTDVEYTFGFTPPTGALVEGIIYRFCTTPLGNCIAPTDLDVDAATSDGFGTSTWQDTTTFTTHAATDENDCDMATTTPNLVCFSRTAVSAESSGVALEHVISGITNPSTYASFYVRIGLYSDGDFETADLTDEGVVAAAIVRQLTVTGRVAERLEFCVAAMDDNAVTPIPDGCSNMPTTTDIAIGTIDDTDVYITPVDDSGTNLANDHFGAAMVNTNASGGVTVSYFPEEQTNVSSSDTDQLYAFRVAPTDCSATASSVTDQCFVSASNATKENIASGSEMFGMYIACVAANDGTISTTNNFAGGTVNALYEGEDAAIAPGGGFTASDCQNETETTAFQVGFASDGAVDDLVSSSTVVDDEMLKFRFAATASATTPEGSYTVTLTYVATPTF